MCSNVSTYKRNIQERSRNDNCRGRVIRITYSNYVFVALVPPYTKHIFRILLSYAACPALPDFPH